MSRAGTVYAEVWADVINETYDEEVWLGADDLQAGESVDDAVRRILMKAAECLRYGKLATFTAGELDLVRHLMPAHEVHQSGAVRWVLNTYGDGNE